MSIGVCPYVVFMLMRTFVFNNSLTNACDLYIIEGKKREKDYTETKGYIGKTPRK
jgi:hypothetical protein